MEKDKHNSFAGILKFAAECRTTMIISVVIAVIGVLCGLSPYLAVSRIIVGFMDGSAGIGYVFFWLSIFLAGAALKAILYARSTLLSHKAAFHIIRTVRERITDKLLKIPMGCLQEHPSGKLKMLFVDEVEKLEYPLAHAIPELSSNITAPIAIFIFLLITDVRMAFIALITLPVGFIISAAMMAGYKKRYDAWFESGERMNNTIVEFIKGIEVIKAYNQTTSSFEKYSSAVKRYRDFTLAWYRSSWPFNAAYTAVFPAVLVAALPFGLNFYLEGSLELSALILSLIMSLGLIPPIMKLIEFTDNFIAITQTETKVNELLSLEEMPYKNEKLMIDNYDIRLSDVSFSYKKQQVLNKVSLDIKENTMTALVGPSGSGKSTITRLISRAWDVQGGSVNIGRRDIRDFPLKQLTSMISSVSQNIYLFNMSIADNIRIGKPEASFEEVVSAAEAAGCSDFINRLPDSYDTVIGSGGDKLSGGERQRIAIARAILKDSPILLLDEATSSIDAENEAKIQDSIAALTAGKTLIVVAHRLSTIVHADNIAVVENGKINTQGRHEELLEKSELYRRMWNAHKDAGEWSIGKRGKGRV